MASRGALLPGALGGDHAVNDDGTLSAIISTERFDIDSADLTRRATALAGFARLCLTTEVPLQIVVRIRRRRDDEDTARPRHRELDAAVRAHWAHRFEATPIHRADVLLATRATDRDGLDRNVAWLLGVMKAAGVGARRVPAAELLAVIADGVAQEDPVAWVEYAHSLRIGDVYIRGFVLSRLPSHSVSAGWLAPLLTMQVESDVTLHLAPASLGDALHKLGRRLRDASAHRLLETERGVIADAHVEAALDAAHSLRHQLARSARRPLLLTLAVTVRASTLSTLHRAADTVRLAFSAASASCEPAHFRHRAAFVTASPLGIDALQTRKLVEPGAAATCVPWLHPSCDDNGGYRLGAELSSGNPVRVAPFDSSLYTNANVAVFAASGHGKSFAVGALVLEAALQGVDAVIIDPESEYRGVVAAVNGSELVLRPGGDAAVNIFDSAAEDPEDAITAAGDLLSVLCGGLNDIDRALVDDAAREAVAAAAVHYRVPLLSDCLPRLERVAPTVAVVVRRFCSGALGQLFNRPTSIQLDRQVNVIALRDMPSDHVAAVTLLIARWLWRLVQHDTRRRHIVFDEVGALCTHPPFRSLLVQLARRCRKYGASLIVATQNAQDLLGSDEGSVVATNCAIAMLGGHRPAEAARMERAFGLTEGQRAFLETASRGEFLLLAGGRRVQMRVDAPAEYRAILTGETQAPTP